MPNARRSSAAPRSSQQPPRAWQRMLSGRRLDLLEPSAFDVEVEDIAHGLARVARWNGQTKGEHAFSVAQHSLVVEEITGILSPAITPAERLTALLHDAPEYVIGDMISPFKNALGVNYRAFEDRLERAIHLRFGLPPKTPAPLKKLIKRADLICAWFEATQLAGFNIDESNQFFGAPPADIRITLEPLPAMQVQAAYVDRFNVLLEMIDKTART